MEPDKSAPRPDNFVQLATEPLFSGKLPDGQPFNPLDHGIFEQMREGQWDKDGRGQVDHAKWMRARAEGGFVGTCRRCGHYMAPEAPEDRGDGSFDYEAYCTNVATSEVNWETSTRYVSGCGANVLAIRGRLMLASSSKSERRAALRKATRTGG